MLKRIAIGILGVSVLAMGMTCREACEQGRGGRNVRDEVVRTEEFTVTSFDGVELKGTATLPSPLKAIVIPVHGSFVQTRDGDLDGTKTWMFPQGTPKRQLFRDIATELANSQVGMLRYDKRASGESGGVYEDTDFEVLAKDILAMYQYARRTYPHIPVGLLGQSEGGLTVLRAWELGAKADFLILQGPALEPLETFLAHQKTRAAKDFLAGRNGDLGKKYPYLTAFYVAMYEGDMLEKILTTDDTHYTLRLGDWSHVTSLSKYRQHRWNGLEKLKGVTCPVTVIFGAEDGNVRPESGQIIVDGKAQGLYPNVEVHVLKGLEHSFRKVDKGDNFVTVMGKPISGDYLAVLREFVRRQLSTP